MKRGQRFRLLANVFVSVRAILPTRLIVAGGKAERTSTLDRVEKGATATGETPMLF
jgi:hypothetical protein